MKYRLTVKAASALAAGAAPLLLAAMAPAPALAAPQPRIVQATSTNYAGWLAGTFNRQATHSARTTFKVPTVTCNSTDANSFVIPGVGLPTGTTTITAAGVAVGCNGTTPFYQGEIVINGTVTPVNTTIHPGDKIITSLTVSATSTTGSFQDATTHFKQPISGPGGKPTGSCIGIDGSEHGPSDPPVPIFGKVVFSAGTINGKTIAGSGATPVNMDDSGGVLQIRTGPLNSTGNGFTSTFVNVG